MNRSELKWTWAQIDVALRPLGGPHALPILFSTVSAAIPGGGIPTEWVEWIVERIRAREHLKLSAEIPGFTWSLEIVP